MKEQLTQYVNLLFAGAQDANDMQQEILQNTLERYDDLIMQGKTPQAAYQLAICGIGDINELLGNIRPIESQPIKQPETPAAGIAKFARTRLLRAVAIFLYIISIIPLIALEAVGLELFGLCGTLAIAAVATALLILAGSKDKKQKSSKEEQPLSPMEKAVQSVLMPVGLCIYLILSFTTQAWYITWLVFPILAAIKGLIKACFDLKEASIHEN